MGSRHIHPVDIDQQRQQQQDTSENTFSGFCLTKSVDQ